MSIFAPAFLLMLHTMVIASIMGIRRYKAVRGRSVDMRYYEFYYGEEPPALRKFSRHVINLLEFPVLFYAVTIIAFVTGLGGTLVLALAWAFVLLRIAHSLIHLGPNVVIWRFRVFVLSMLVLMAYICVVAGAVLL